MRRPKIRRPSRRARQKYAEPGPVRACGAARAHARVPRVRVPGGPGPPCGPCRALNMIRQVIERKQGVRSAKRPALTFQVAWPRKRVPVPAKHPRLLIYKPE